MNSDLKTVIELLENINDRLEKIENRDKNNKNLIVNKVRVGRVRRPIIRGII